MKKIFAAWMLAGGIFQACAQQPQYIMNTSQLSGIYSYHGGEGFINGGARKQTIYYPSEFPGMPAGAITTIYLRNGKKLSGDYHFRNLTIKMGYMAMDENHTDSAHFNVVPPLTWYATDTVFYTPTYTVSAASDSGDWLRFDLQQPFSYDATRNFIVDIAQDSAYPVSLYTSFRIAYFFANTSDYSYYVQAFPHWGPNWNTIPDAQHNGFIPIIAFDILPTGIHNISKSQGIAIYPNPAQNVLYIKGGSSYAIYDMTGRVVSSGSPSHEGVNVARLAVGLYAVKVIDEDGKAITLKFTKQ